MKSSYIASSASDSAGGVDGFGGVAMRRRGGLSASTPERGDGISSAENQRDLDEAGARGGGRLGELFDELGSGEELRHDHVVSRGEMPQGHCDREPSRRDSGVGRSGFPVAEE